MPFNSENNLPQAPSFLQRTHRLASIIAAATFLISTPLTNGENGGNPGPIPDPVEFTNADGSTERQFTVEDDTVEIDGQIFPVKRLTIIIKPGETWNFETSTDLELWSGGIGSQFTNSGEENTAWCVDFIVGAEGRNFARFSKLEQ